MRITADITNIRTPGALQVYLGFILRAPAYYGHNLDALYDILTERTEVTELTLCVPETLCQEMASYLTRLTRVLDDAAEDNPAFRYSIVRV